LSSISLFSKENFCPGSVLEFFVCERKLLGFRAFGEQKKKFVLHMSWTKSFRTIPGRTAPGQKFEPPKKEEISKKFKS